MSEEDKRSCVSLEGALTIYTAADRKAELLQSVRPGMAVEFNLARVDEIDCAGLQLLALAKREAESLGGQLHLTSHSPAVIVALDLSGLAGVFGDPVLVEPA